jgi:hypothetical protein
MKRSLAVALLYILTSAQFAHAQPATKAPAADKASQKVMRHWVGNWTGGVAGAAESVVPHIGTTPDHAKVEWTLDQHFLQGANLDKDNKPVAIWLMRHDPNTGKYQVWFFTSKADVSVWNGTWDESNQTMNWETGDTESGVKGSGHTTFAGNRQNWTMSVTRDGKTQESSGSLTRQ